MIIDFDLAKRCSRNIDQTLHSDSGWPISIGPVYNAPWFRIEIRGNRYPDGKPGLLQIYQYRYLATMRDNKEAAKRAAYGSAR